MLFPVVFGLGSVLRNRGRSLAALAGALLVVTLISGANMAVDAAALRMLNIALDEVIADILVFSPSPGQKQDILQRIEDVEAVVGVEPVLFTGVSAALDASREGSPGSGSQASQSSQSDQELPQPLSDSWTPVPIMGVDSSFEPDSTRLGFPEGLDYELGDSEILVSTHLAEWLREQGKTVRIGDSLTLLFPRDEQDSHDSATFKIKGIYEVNPEKWLRQDLYTFPEATTGIVTNLGTAREIATKYGEHVHVSHLIPHEARGDVWTSTSSVTLFLVKTDRRRLIHPTDTERSMENLFSAEKEVEMALRDKETVTRLPVEDAIRAYASQLESSRTSFVTAALPVIALGIYLAIIGTDIGFAGRRRQISMLKCRGASKDQITGLLLTEAITLGAVAGLIGLVLGFFVTSLVVVPTPGGRTVSFGLNQLAALGISPPTMASGILLGIGVMSAAFIMPIRRMHTVTALEGSGRYSETYEKEDYKKALDLALVITPISIYLAILIFGQEAPPAHSLTGFIFTILLAVGVLLIPFTPFMLIMGATRLLTRGTNKTYRYISRAMTPLARDLQPLIARNLARHPRRTSRVAVLITLSLAFGTFIMAWAASTQKQYESQIAFEMGSDIAIIRYQPVAAEDLLDIEGVEGVCEIVRARSRQPVEIYGLDPDQYRHCIEENPYMTRQLDDLLSLLSDDEEGAIVFISDEGRPWPVGEMARISLQNPNNQEERSAEFRILGYFRYAPGLPTLHKFRSVMLVRKEHLESMGSMGTTETGPDGETDDPYTSLDRMLIRTSRAANATLVVDRILNQHEKLGGSVESLEDVVKEYREDPENTAIRSFMELEFGFTAIMATFGLGLLVFVAGLERGREIAGQIARGSSRRQVTKLLIGEALSIVSLAYIIGPPVGLFTVYAVNKVMIRDITIPTALAFPPILILMLGVTAVTLTAASILAAIRVNRRSLSQALRTA